MNKLVCEKTNKYPFTCTNCKRKNYCKMEKYIYHTKNTQINYSTKLSSSRADIDATID